MLSDFLYLGQDWWREINADSFSPVFLGNSHSSNRIRNSKFFEVFSMNAAKSLTEKITFAGLRQQAERLEIPGFAKMRKPELIKAISDALS